jgi:uncharacterized protein with PIN domain
MIEHEQVSSPDKRPICPHCQNPITKIYSTEIRGILGRRYIYYCSMCLKVLGISHRKGLLMG